MNKSGLFQISADFELNRKPDWLDDFRVKYDLPYDYHVTFKAITYFRDEDLEKMKAELKEMAENHKPLTVIFDELSINRTSHGWCIMINAEHNEKLFELQREICERFSKYGEVIIKEREDREKNFQPHITIGRRITDDKLEMAKSEIGESLKCDTIIKNLALSIAQEDTFKEWSKPGNRMFYKISK